MYLLLTDNIAAPKPLEHNQMNIDHAEVYEYALKEFKKKRKFTPEFIQSVCARVMKHTGRQINTEYGFYDETRGDFRLVPVTAGGTDFPHHTEVKELTRKMCEKYNKSILQIKNSKDILDLAADVHYSLVSIHPFSDGNGRTARIMMNAVLFTFDMPRLILPAEKKELYYKALKETRKKSDIIVFRDYIYQNYINQLTTELEKQKNVARKKGMYLGF